MPNEQTNTGANLFESLGFSEKGQAHSTNVRSKASELYMALSELPKCRETSLAITKLEEVVMWANKGISRNP